MSHSARAMVPPPDSSRHEPLRVDTTATNSGTNKSAHGETVITTPATPEILRMQKEIQMFRKAFDENMRNKPVKHDHGYVLLISWEDNIDDLKVKDEVTKLKILFEDRYSFGVEWKKLKSNKRHQLKSILSTFMHEHDNEDTLLIIYYAGHGTYAGDRLWLQASTSQQTEDEKERNRIAWSNAETNITGSMADVLVIFDCCEAGGFGGQKVRSSRPNFEFIAACGVKERARGPGKHSFTSGLMWALEDLHHDCPFTSISLVEKIKTYKYLSKDQTPELLRRDEFADGLVWIAPLIIKGPEPESVAKSEKRDPRHEYIDLRFNFYRRVNIEDATQLAKHLSHLVNHKEKFEAKHITLLDKSSTFSKAVAAMRHNVHGKRKFSSPSTYVRKDQSACSEITSPLLKRQRLQLPHPEQTPTAQILAQDLTSQGALYHFRMFLNCSLQTVGSNIARVADRIRPPLQERVIEDSVLASESEQ